MSKQKLPQIAKLPRLSVQETIDCLREITQFNRPNGSSSNKEYVCVAIRTFKEISKEEARYFVEWWAKELMPDRKLTYYETNQTFHDAYGLFGALTDENCQTRYAFVLNIIWRLEDYLKKHKDVPINH